MRNLTIPEIQEAILKWMRDNKSPLFPEIMFVPLEDYIAIGFYIASCITWRKGKLYIFDMEIEPMQDIQEERGIYFTGLCRVACFSDKPDYVIRS